jgi:acyl-CoA reductase LuxC
METYQVPLIVRGKLIEDYTLEFGGRKGGAKFVTPDVNNYLDELTGCPMDSLGEFQNTPIEEIARFLQELGSMMDPGKNDHLRQAFELSCHTSGISRSILESLYSNVGATLFSRDYVLEYVDKTIGREFLEGWVARDMNDGTVSRVRAFGARAVHVIAGNTPAVAFNTVMRSAVTRSDSIVKMPSNDPLTFGAILRTAIQLDADHPVTRHLSGAYWKGGDESFEAKLYRPQHIEKIVAWGGFDSIKHITKYLQPGLDLITLDPKQSSSIIGHEALQDDDALREVAKRAACDIGAYNQELCANARVIYIECDYDDPEQLEKLNRFGNYIFQALKQLPSYLSTESKYVDSTLKEEMDGLFMLEDWYKTHRDSDTSGGVIVSQNDEPVSFASSLINRVANLVPLKSMDAIINRINSSTQTVGVYPEQTKLAIADRLALRGAQIIISLGYVARINSVGPMDAIEPERRMLKWLTCQTQDETVPGPWVDMSEGARASRTI